MSLLLLIDGYNVIAPVAAPSGRADSNWLLQERNRLVQRLIDHLDAPLRHRTCVVFDAADPPPDRSSKYEADGIVVQFAVGYPEADDLLEEIIEAHSAPKTLAVISSDHRIQAAARRRGAVSFDSQDWLDHLLSGRTNLSPSAGNRWRRGKNLPTSDSSGAGQGSDSGQDKPDALADGDVQRWMDDFGF